MLSPEDTKGIARHTGANEGAKIKISTIYYYLFDN